MVLTPAIGAGSLARIEATLTDEAGDTMADAPLEALRRAIPAARSLPLLRLLATGASGRAILDYLDVSRVAVRVEPC
jgi:hypothetical protein